ncbi:hypothetical protein, conserved [Leishmania tarentolae]|uniref:Uncharacterized protein n=1 Tax=Leishmania tarentolae TaxID=5689 RepID=A0A640KLV4_LEITA|nr:hypothetical protein, conserved [Leishmania tarentolae]
MEDPLPPHTCEVHVDAFGIEGDVPQPPALHCVTPNCAATEPLPGRSEEKSDDVRATQHSAPVAVPIPTVSRSGSNSNSDSPRQAVVGMRQLSACGDANEASPEGSRLSPEVMAASSTVPVRAQDPFRHSHLLKSLHHGATNGNAVAAASGGKAAAESDAGDATRSESETMLHRSASHAHRCHASTLMSTRGSTSNSKFPFKMTFPASPELPEEVATPALNSQEDMKHYVHAIMEQHMRLLSAWYKRLSVAEVYRDKPLRTGGRPAPVRPQDLGFLERVEQNLDSYLQQLEAAKSLLAHSYEAVPPIKSGQQGDTKAWQDYCSRAYYTLSDLTVEENLIRFRVNRVLHVEHQDFKGSMCSRTASPSVSSTRGVRSYSREGASVRASSRPASGASSKAVTPRQQSREVNERRRGCSVQSVRSLRSEAAAGAGAPCPSMSTVTNGSPSSHARHLVSGGVVQRGNGAIRPGHSSVLGPDQASAVSVDQRRQPRQYGRPSTHHEAKSNTSLSSAPALVLARQQRRLLALHPDTVSSKPQRTGNMYDNQTPYGRLSPQRRNVSLDSVLSLNRSVPQLPEFGVDNTASHSAAPSRRSLARSAAHQPASGSPQLRTYSSPRGAAGAQVVTPSAPTLQSLRHRLLLERIEHYEKNAATLQPGDLKLARECFYQLYGEQKGLHQYCQWIDDIAIKILRRA